MKKVKHDINEEAMLLQIKKEKEAWESAYDTIKLEIEADIELMYGKKRDNDKIGDFTLMSQVRSMISRSYRNKIPVTIRCDKTGNERKAKMINTAFKEDQETAYSKAIRLYKEKDKYSMGVAIIARTGWDGVHKCNTFECINPLLAVPDPYGDYFSWDYRYIWFYNTRTKDEIEKMWGDPEEFRTGKKQDQVKKEQWAQWINWQDDKGVFNTYIHFFIYDEVKYFAETDAEVKTVLYIEKIKPWSKNEEEDSSLIRFPFSFYYWSPKRYNFFWDRPANYIRDVQKWKSEMRNLQIDKMRAELYPTYLYNKDFVSKSDIKFWFNNVIGVTAWLNGANIPLNNLVTPIVRDLRIDGTSELMREVEEDLQKWTSIWPIAQWSTPERREALGTNKLVQDNTDINLSLNEEIDMIWDFQYVDVWFAWYYQNFKNADEKLVYSATGIWYTPKKIKKEDFFLEGNLTISLETSSKWEENRRRIAAAHVQTSPVILSNPNINESSKRILMRNVAKSNGYDEEMIDVEIPMTEQYRLQEMENEALIQWIDVPVNPDDNDEEHIIALWDVDPDNVAMVAHQTAHIMASIEKKKSQMLPMQDNTMLNGAMSQAMSQAGSEIASNS